MHKKRRFKRLVFGAKAGLDFCIQYIVFVLYKFKDKFLYT